jgi:large subunit ribosomal protein L35
MAKTKIKTHKGLAKRIKVTKSGKVLRRRAGGSHLMSGKPSKVIRRLRRDVEICKSDADNILKQLGNAKYAR